MQFSIGILVLFVIVGAGASDESCPKFCPLIEAPVCGTDGKTYPNWCSLRSVACRDQSDLGVAYKGECKGAETCATKRCKFGARCRMVTGRAHCFCYQRIQSIAPGYPDSVCGTDNKTYVNMDALKRAMCKAQKLIEIAKKGRCEHSCFDCGFLMGEFGRHYCGEEDGEIKCVAPKSRGWRRAGSRHRWQD